MKNHQISKHCLLSAGTDKTVSGSITTTGLAGTMAHIHSGDIGANGEIRGQLKPL